MNGIKHLRQSAVRVAAFIGVLLLSIQCLISTASGASASGRFEVYCDGVGIFLPKIDGAPGSGKLLLFSQMSFPPGTMGGSYFGQGKWSDVSIFRDGCLPDGKCESIGSGRVWIDAPKSQQAPPKQISGKYQINLNGKVLEGAFAVRKRVRKRPVLVCM